SPAADLTPFVPRFVADWVTDARGSGHRSVEGTLVFSDLSGFTAMSERLAQLGKVGAEELTDHLDSIFTELITVAGGLGGSMLKFGGDALLTLFWGPNHPERAASACIEMQATLNTIGLISTSAGESRLQMTVGAHTGTFDFFLAGRSHQALFVCGNDAATTVLVEGSASAGEVRVSPELAGALDPSMLDEAESPQPLLVNAPSIDRDIPAVPPWREGTGPDTFVPTMLRNLLASGIELTEHRQMVVAFLHLSNVDELIAANGPGETAHRLDELVSFIQEAFARDDVAFISTDINEGGPKIVCATGAVRTFENDEERMLRALREVVDHPSPIELCVGVHRGHGFRGYVGPDFRRTFAVIGDVVNTAARVMSKARPGQILATADVLDRSDTLFETRALDPFAAKGKAKPLVAVEVGAIAGVRERAGSDLPFVGRTHQLELLTASVDSVRKGMGGVLEIVGEAGLGKTRIVNELLSGIDDMTVVRERCGRYASSTPYFPFRRLLSETIAGRSMEEIAALLEVPAPGIVPYLPLLELPLGRPAGSIPEIDQLSTSQRRAKIHEVVAAAVSALLDTPAVWFVDDTHSADAASIELLRHLAVVDGMPLLILVARRPDGEAIGGAERTLVLDELEASACASLLKSASRVHLLPKETQRLAERAHGNPLFLIELAAVVAEGRDLEQLPDSLEAVLAARIDSLTPAERRIVRHLAVIGSRFQPSVARAVVDGLPPPGDPSWSRLNAFVDTTKDEWQFTQTLVRETAYEGLSFRERRDVHHRTGSALEELLEDPFALSELLSLHFHAAKTSDKALAYSEHAAKKARGAYAFLEAATFLRRCVDAARWLDDLTALGDSLTGLAHTELDLGEFTQARDHFEESLEIKRAGGNIQGVAAQLNGLGLVARQLGDYPRAQDLFGEAVALLRTLHDPENLASAFMNLGTVAWLQGKYDVAKSQFEAALEEERRLDNIRGIAIALETLGSVALALGDFKTARQHYERGLRFSTELEDKPAMAVALNNLGNVAFQQGDHTEGRRRFEASLAIRRELNDRLGVGSTLTNLGTIEYFARNYETARERYEEGLAIAREIGDQRGSSLSLHNLGEIAIIDGDTALARQLIQEGLDIRRALGDPRGQAQSLTSLGMLASESADDDQARASFSEALDLLEQLGNKPGIAECVELVAALRARAGDPVGAATLLGCVDAILEGIGAARSWSDAARAELEISLGNQLGSEVYEMAVGVGHAMSLERTLALAREALDSTPDAEPTAVQS
ncbi:MAG: tetratricopeptide repeat protein, partial [Actinomycetota bacterium]